MNRMPLALLVGPANAGKVARLLDRYLGAMGRDPFLVVPNRAEIDRVEHDLLAHSPCLLGGWIGTFDDLFERIARGNGAHRPVATDLQRTLVLRGALAGTSLNGLGASARFGGFSDSLLGAIAELERLGLWDRDLERKHAVERVERELEAWDDRPVFAYGFEDLTGVQWALLQALAGRTDVTVSLPYEPGRPAFAALERTAGDLSELASGRV